MKIAKLSCQLNCPDNSHVFELLQSTSASVTGWNLNIEKGPWNIDLNDEVRNCGTGILDHSRSFPSLRRQDLLLKCMTSI